MSNKIETIEDYMCSIPEERKIVVEKLREVIKNNITEGFAEVMSYGSIGYVVPHKLYPAGYKVDPSLPLPFIGIANRKNYITFSHWGLYTNNDLMTWFKEEYPKHSRYKISMGKSCIYFKRMDDIPYELIGKLCRKLTVDEYIKIYEQAFVK